MNGSPLPSLPGRRVPVIIAGPTAVGKTEIALLLAEKIGGEIISVDSMQVYRGLDIGTAKPTPHERVRVPHHLLDVVGLADSFDAAKFVELARVAIAEIDARDRVPVLCGGTGLYFKALLVGLGEAPPANPSLRAELEAMSLPDLLRELAERDPATHANIDQQNQRRVVRALEVIRLTGKPFSAQRADWKSAAQDSRAKPWFGLARSNSDLRNRIDTRVDQMFQAGLIAETERLLTHGLAENRTALQALGYRQVVEHLHAKRPVAETIELVKIRTRQFAKRQMTWFKRQLTLNWLELDSAESPSSTVDRIAETISNQRSVFGYADF